MRLSALLADLSFSSLTAWRGKAGKTLCLFFGSLLLCLAAEPALAAPNANAAASLAASPVPVSFSPTFERAADIIFGLFIGIMLTASMYLFFIWIVLRERGQIFLMLLLLCVGVNMASTNSSMMHFIGLHSGDMPSLLQSYSMILAYIFSILFTSYFLELEITAPFMRLPLFGLVGLLAILLALTIMNQNLTRFILPTLGAVSIAAVLIAGLTTLWRQISGSGSHILAFIFFLLGDLAGPLYDLGYLDSEASSKNLTYAGFSIATMMFAIVIAGQFAKRQEEKEKALELSNERFSLAARGSSEGLFDWNRLTNEVYFSEQFRRILGVAIETNIRGLKEWVKLIQASDRKALFAALRKFRDTPNISTISFEYRIVRGPSNWRWIHTKAVATRDPHNGHIIRLVGSIGDVTQRKRSEVELRASEARFRSITEAHPVPVLITKLQDNSILYVSPGAEALLGLPSGMVMSHRLDRFLHRPNERKEIITEITSGHEVNMKEVVLSRGDGERLPAALSARRINYQNEAAMVIGLYDLTERKKAEKQIAEQQEALQQSEKMAALGGLLAGVAHELNNPLSVVMGQTSLLMEGPGEDKTKSRAEKIFKAADRCSRIVKSFLALARRKPPERKQVQLNTIINNSLELLNYQFRNEAVVLKLDLADNLPPITGDEDQMTQVFTNLALNAAQAMHEWTGPHNLTITSSLDPSGGVRIVVADSGPGIPPDMRVKVFEPFFTTKAGHGGTGVGLSLCINIVEGHGGRIQLEDTAGGGATFVISLPASEAAGEAKAEAIAPTAISGVKLRMLLVDDEVELAQTLADLLEPLGHDIDLAANGAIALEKIAKKSFDVIISDLRMPVLDGPGLYAALAEKRPEYVKKIIYVTGDTLSPNVHEFLSQTPVPVIEKPYRLADVQEALVKLLKE